MPPLCSSDATLKKRNGCSGLSSDMESGAADVDHARETYIRARKLIATEVGCEVEHPLTSFVEGLLLSLAQAYFVS